ncbi:ATPase inhibitor [Pleosporales sp. CAS-2024a]
MLRTSIIKSARSVAAPRYFSVAARRMAEGATGSGASRPTGSAGGQVYEVRFSASDAFTKRESAQEELYIRQEERAKLLAIQQKLRQQREHMEELDEHMSVPPYPSSNIPPAVEHTIAKSKTGG